MADDGNDGFSLPVDYLGGFIQSPRPKLGDRWYFDAAPEGCTATYVTQTGLLSTNHESCPFVGLWDEIASVHFASEQATRANIPALVVFGVLGLAARRQPGTYIALSTSDGDAFFRSAVPAASLALRLHTFVTRDAPQARGKVLLEGQILSAPPAPPTEVGVLSQFEKPGALHVRSAPVQEQAELPLAAQIRQLAELRDAGALSEGEFTTAKRRLLEGV